MTPAGPGSGPDAAPGADPDAAPDRPADPRLARLLRWYPRGWRERYGDEFLALVEDTLGGREPGWRLHLSVVRTGLRERARRVVPVVVRRAKAELDKPLPLRRLGLPALAGLLYFWSAQNLPQVALSVGAAHRAQGAGATDAIAGLGVVIGVSVTAGALVAGPALIRFLRAGGGPRIWPPAVRAVVATVAAAVMLGRLLGTVHSMTSYGQMVTSVTYAAWLISATLMLAVALLHWESAAGVAASQFDLRPEVRAAQVMLGEVAMSAVLAVPPVQLIWVAQTEYQGWLLDTGVALLVACCAAAPYRLRQAWLRGRRLRAAAARGR